MSALAPGMREVLIHIPLKFDMFVLTLCHFIYPGHGQGLADSDIPTSENLESI